MQRLDWMDDARCREVGAEEWFPITGGSTATAKAICNGDGKRIPPCLVRAACLRWALDRGERTGIWGGLTARERDELRRRRAAA